MTSGSPASFRDRQDAGQRLSDALAGFRDANPLVLALPRGGVPVGYEVAEALDAPLDVALVRKIGAPGHPELGVGAVVDGRDPQVVLNDEVMQMTQPQKSYLERETNRQLQEIERRRHLYRGDNPPESVEQRTVIVVDDGIATGGTVKAALKALKHAGTARTILAIPVSPTDTLEALRAEADDVVCLVTPEPFHAVGIHYDDFDQIEDAEVVDLLKAARQRRSHSRSDLKS